MNVGRRWGEGGAGVRPAGWHTCLAEGAAWPVQDLHSPQSLLYTPHACACTTNVLIITYSAYMYTYKYTQTICMYEYVML